MMNESLQISTGRKQSTQSQTEFNPFHQIVRNNLNYWLRRFDWSTNPQIEELSLEKENIIKAIHAGLRVRATHALACHLLYVSSDTMLQIGSRRPWWLLTQKAIDLCPNSGCHNCNRLILCKAKHLLLDENYEEVRTLIDGYLSTEKAHGDVDTKWESLYLRGVAACRLRDPEGAQEAVDEVSTLLRTVTLLQPHLCKGKIAMLGGELSMALEDWEKAEYCLGISLHHLSKIKASYSLAQTLELYGKLHENKYDLGEAIKVWEQAVELIPESFSFEMRSRLQANIARLNLKQGKLIEAQQILENLDYGMMRLLGCYHLHLEASTLLVEVLGLLGETEQAAWMSESIELQRSDLTPSQN